MDAMRRPGEILDSSEEENLESEIGDQPSGDQETIQPTGRAEGVNLIQTVVSLSGLPESWIEPELQEIISQSGANSETVSLDQLRGALIAYLEAIHSEISE